LPVLIQAQNDTIKSDVGFMGVASTGNAPFWLQSNRYGLIPASPASAGMMAGINKEFGTKERLFDYGFKANLLVQAYGNKTAVRLHEFYAKARFSVFDLIIGAREEQLGNQDSTLSCGGFLFSKNARPMPKITLGIEHFTPVPFTFGFLEVKGAITHGWFNNTVYAKNVFLHHKYVYAKVGGKLPVHLQYGMDHVAQWGGNILGYGQQPAGFSDFVDIFLGRSGGTNAFTGEQINALGNHIISQSTRLDVELSGFTISGYWQKISEDGPIKNFWNAPNKADGLWGVSIRNTQFTYIKGILYEYLNTTDQSGPYHDKDGIIYGGSDSYFGNYIYSFGWSFYGRTIGIPFILPPTINATNGSLASINNRVQVRHFGIEGDITGYNYKFLSSFSKNYGTYYVPLVPYGLKNTSLLLEINKQFPMLSNIEIGCSVGVDFGKLYGNSVGCLFSIRKRGNLFHY
jgi:hypothetical protein